MNIWQRIHPRNIPPEVVERGELTTLREYLLQQSLLLQIPVIGWFAAPHIVQTIQGRSESGVGLWVFLLAFALLLPFLRHWPFSIRAIALGLFPYLLGTQITLTYGPQATAIMAYACAILIGALLFDLSTVLPWEGVVFLTPLMLTLAVHLNILPTPTPENILTFNSLPNWYNGLVLLAYLAALGILSLPFLGERINQLGIEKGTLERQLRSTRTEFERELAERTGHLQRRIRELYTASTIARTVNTASDQATLLQQVADLIQQEFNLYYVGIFLIDESGKFAVLRAGTGEAGRRMLAEGHRLAVGGNSMIGWATARKEPRISQDVSLELVRFSNPHLPLTRSELALPILRRGQCLGAISIQSTQVRAFEEDDILVLQGIADSLGLALENHDLFQRIQQLREEVRTLARAHVTEEWGNFLKGHDVLEATYQSPSAPPTAGSSTHLAQFPLILRDQVIGTISLEMTQPELTSEEIAWLDAVAMQTATALENARLFQETQRQALLEQRLNEISSTLSRVETVDDILRVAVQALAQLPNVTETSIHLIPPEPQTAKDNGR
ncbi:GAF domain-containing protein [Thermanaerothrix sp. 4228-RoL]|uniref:GAF domain-containing protein n=1 Tax=Thermanaerothrix solaris TaxID=3058434 RepID=A0ABU3NQP3_9CHLR|nr:GAF domain-containing protein [Thermanaerothrix sp. 4228-RoL]MDT8899153.1 GAF domain-containing protein [Thermanaerothrix sp. 4228-RoL]